MLENYTGPFVTFGEVNANYEIWWFKTIIPQSIRHLKNSKQLSQSKSIL